MTEEPQRKLDSSIDSAPVWVRALQAAIVGIAAGLALHLLLSLVVLQGKELWSRPAAAPTACKKSSPPRETVAPATRGTPSVSAAVAVAGRRG